MVEQNVGYWACGGVSVMDPEWERRLDQRIAAGQRTGKTMLSPERRILLHEQLVDEVLGPLEEFRPSDGVPPRLQGSKVKLRSIPLRPRRDGCRVVAVEQGIDPSDLGYRRDKPLALAHNQRLTHHVGVNGFFTALVAAARRSHGNAELLQ